jgi:membrane-bound lytic murein transglycosylase D
MIKKHLITCSVSCVLVFISGLFICAKTDTKKGTASASGYKFVYARNDFSNNFSFADEAIPVNNPRIDKKLRISLIRNTYRHIQSNVLQDEAASLFPIIEPILKAYGIPDDFKYIPLVEAGLKKGVSKRGAAGWWQFMPGTARTYGLKVGHGRDERYNIRKSTIAACIYIKELYGQFNSWTLAAASYNIGEIKMARAIRVQSQDNYFRMHFNPEAGIYLYRVIAMKAIIENPQKYGYKNYGNFTPVNTSVQPTILAALN